MRKYELMTIFSTEDEKSKAGQEAVRSVLGKYGVVIEKEEPYGDRDLTYEVKKLNRGRFVLFTIKANPAKLVEIDRDFKLEENVLKYLFVKIDEE
jgi:small subunit ribosomal protein S6